MPEKGQIFIVSGPSGSGKGTVLRHLFKNREGLYYSVSATTRKPRPGETNGKDYYFLTDEEFLKQIKNGEMLEYAKYCGNYYGTPRLVIEERLKQGYDVILEIDVQGARKILESLADVVSIFLMPPSLKELERRLRKRGTETEEWIQERLTAAKVEIDSARDYQYIVINDYASRAAQKISCIITAEKLKSCRFYGGRINAEIISQRHSKKQ